MLIFFRICVVQFIGRVEKGMKKKVIGVLSKPQALDCKKPRSSDSEFNSRHQNGAPRERNK